MKKIVIYIAIIILSFVIGLLCRPQHIRESIKRITDTLVIRDTQVVEKPVLVEKTHKESLLVQVRDTVRIKDTVYISLPMESKTYKGDGYMAIVSGYMPSLDKIEVYPKTKVIRESVTQSVIKRNSLALGIEANYIYTPYIPVYLQYSRMVRKNFTVHGRVMYDIPTRLWGIGAGVDVNIGW